jgi:hypothetical protein
MTHSTHPVLHAHPDKEEELDYSKRVFKVHPDRPIEDKVTAVKRGGTLTFVNECDEYPDFEVRLQNSDHHITGTRTGSTTNPIKLQMPNEDIEFKYALVFKHKSGNRHHGPDRHQPKDGEFKMAKTCGPCP